ncbi:MAG: homocysteine S-methyltransferase family protein [Myxococcales bacterium]|nr:homocysteine S-methyltransferase family protein [Myxococcales bacterium]
MSDRLPALLVPLGSSRPVLGDAAMGTALLRAVEPGTCLEELSVVRPALVRDVHLGHLAAGARLVRTNTFGASRARLATHELVDVASINAAAVARAREAIAASDRGPVVVAGVLGPGADREQAEALAAAGVDLFLIETARTVAEAGAILSIALDLGPVVVSFSPEANGRLADGAPLGEACRALPQADGVGLNCGQGARAMVTSFAELPADRPRFVFPSAGLPTAPSGEPLVWPEAPATFAAAAGRMRGASVLGGCCGTTAAHLAALGDLLGAATKGDA